MEEHDESLIQEEGKVENVFRNRNYTLTFLGALVSNVSALLYSFAVSFLILKLTNNNSLLQGLYLALTGITFVIFSPIGGIISDRLNKVRIMYICDYLRGLVILIGAILFIFIEENGFRVVSLFAIGIIGNIIGACFSPASSSLLPLIVKSEQLQQANSYFTLMSSFQSIVGVLLAGVLYSVLKIEVLFIIVGVGYLLSGLSEMLIRYKHEKNEERLTLKLFFNDFSSGLKYLKGQKAILSLLFAVIFLNFFMSPIYDNFFPYFVETDLANSDYLFKSFITPEMWSAIATVFLAISSIIFSIVLSVRPTMKNPGKKVKLFILLTSIVVVVMALLFYVFVVRNNNVNGFIITTLVTMFILGGLLVLINVPISTTMQQKTEPSMLGKVSSILQMMSQGLIPFSTFLAGLVINYFGSLALLFSCGAGLLITSLFLFFNKSVNAL